MRFVAKRTIRRSFSRGRVRSTQSWAATRQPKRCWRLKSAMPNGRAKRFRQSRLQGFVIRFASATMRKPISATAPLVAGWMQSFARTKRGCGCKPRSIYCRRPAAVSERACCRCEMESSKNPVRIGNAQAFWGDLSDAAADMLAREPELDYLTTDYLAEVSMSILAMQRERDSSAGYARDFIDVVRSLLKYWSADGGCKLISNAGGLNPRACAAACQEVLANAGCGHLRIAEISADDVLE